MNKIINTFRKNTVASWGAALFMGLVFRYVDAIARNQIFNWCRNWDFGSSTQPTPESQFLGGTRGQPLKVEIVATTALKILFSRADPVIVCRFAETAATPTDSRSGIKNAPGSKEKGEKAHC